MSESSSERVEMVVDIYESADAVRGHGTDTGMEDVDTERRLKTQQTGGDTAWGRCYILTVVCLLVLCVLLLTGIIVMWIKFNNLDTENNHLQTSYNTLTKERDQLQRERDGYCRTFCDLSDWKCFSNSFYYMSNENKTWDGSRKDCRDKGADLVIINSKEEQEFISKQLERSEYWIGLSDRAEEGKWKWVDDTPLTTGYWATGEPNDKGDEDCAETYRSSNGILCNDKNCSHKQRWICEKRISQ